MKLRDRYTKPGPGVAPDAPRSRGLTRWWEVVSRDAGKFFMSASLCMLALLIYAGAVTAAVAARSLPLLLLGAALGGAMEGTVFCGLVDTVLRSLRDEPGFWWHTWKRALRQNWRQSLVPGALFGVIYGGLVFTLFLLDPQTTRSSQLVALGLSALFVTALAAWFWPQVALLTLPLPLIFKNSLLLALAHPKQSLIAAACYLAYTGVAALLFPVSLPLVVLTLWVPVVSALLAVYCPLDEAFAIEDGLKKQPVEPMSGDQGLSG